MALRELFLPKDRAPLAAGFEDKLRRIVQDWMRRRKLLEPDGTYVTDPDRHYDFFVASLCYAVGEDPQRLWAGHARTRKRLQAKLQYIMFGEYDRELEASGLYWLEMQAIEDELKRERYKEGLAEHNTEPIKLTERSIGGINLE